MFIWLFILTPTTLLLPFEKELRQALKEREELLYKEIERNTVLAREMQELRERMKTLEARFESFLRKTKLNEHHDQIEPDETTSPPTK
jgi:chaperonin cofactor prefoldin